MPRDPPGHARVAAPADPPRLADVPGARATRTSASSSRTSSASSSRAATRSSARSSTARRGASAATSALFRDARRAARALPAGRRLRALPRARRARGRARDARAARRHRARAGRREHRDRSRASAPRRATSCAAPRRSIAVSRWLRDRLEAAVPEARGKTEVVDCGVDLERFAPRDCRGGTSRASGWTPTGRASSASEASRSARTSSDSRARSSGAARARSRSSATARSAPRSKDGPGSASSAASATTRCRRGSLRPTSLCQPSLEEPFGLATLEAMASARSVVATTVGGPPEFVTPESGVLVDPARRRRARLGALTRPRRSRVRTSPAVRRPALTTSSCRRTGWRRSSCEPLRDRRA